MEAVARQPIKKINFFRILQCLYWRPPADQKARGLWVRDCQSPLAFWSADGPPSADQKARGLWVRDWCAFGISVMTHSLKYKVKLDQQHFVEEKVATIKTSSCIRARKSTTRLQRAVGLFG